ncbi:MAG: hypothetical protein R6V04_16180 [bacterium]
MKKIFITLFLIINVFCLKAGAQQFTETVRKQVNQKEISQTDALFLQAVAMYAPDKLPVEYRNLDFEVQKCGFGLQTQLNINFKKFSHSQKEFLSSYLSRPDLPYSYISPSSLFQIHYTTTGSDAVPTEDKNGSGIPDYVEEVARTMDYNYQIEVLSIGLNEPPVDNTDGPEWDVYIKHIPNYYGYTSFDTKISSNPAVWTSYITIDNDYTHTPTSLFDGMKITTAHEFFHMIQLGYNFRNDDIFLMEVASTWMEDVIYDDVNQYWDYLGSFFQSTNVAFNTYDGLHEYGLCIWFHFLEKRLQSIDFVVDIWNYIIDYPAVQALDQFLNDYGTDFQNELTLFYAWNYLTGSRADTLNYYSEGNFYPEIQDKNLDGRYTITTDTTISDIIVSTGAKYYKFILKDGTSIVLVPVNTDTVAFYNYNKEFTMNITRKSENIYQYYLGQGMYLNLASEEGGIFKGTTIIQKPDNTHNMFSVDAVSPELLKSDDISACYPNPFIIEEHGYVSIPFELEQSGEVKIKIFTPSGYLVWENSSFFMGLTFFKWEGRNIQGRKVSGGIYTYVITSGNKVLRQGKIAVIN